jgi:hypothetical protein
LPAWQKTHDEIDRLIPDGGPEKLRRSLRALS